MSCFYSENLDTATLSAMTSGHKNNLMSNFSEANFEQPECLFCKDARKNAISRCDFNIYLAGSFKLFSGCGAVFCADHG